MTKTLDDHIYDIIGAAMKVHQALGSGRTRSQYVQAMRNKLGTIDYKVSRADPVRVLDEDGDFILSLQPDFWIQSLNLLIKVFVIQKTMGYRQAEEARNYLAFNPEAKVVLLLNFGMRSMNTWKFPNEE